MIRELAVQNSINNLLSGLEFAVPEIPGLDGLTVNQFVLEEIDFAEVAQNGNTKTFNFDLSVGFTADIGGAEVTQTIVADLPLEFTSANFETITPTIALAGGLSCGDIIEIQGGVDNPLVVLSGALITKCDEEGVVDIIAASIVELSDGLQELVGPAVNQNNDFDNDLANSINELNADGFQVLDDELLADIINFFIGQVQDIGFVEDFTEAIQDGDLEDVLEALEDLLEEFDIEFDADEIDFGGDDDNEDNDFLPDIEDFFPDGFDPSDFDPSQFFPRALRSAKNYRKLQPEQFSPEVEALLALLPPELAQTVAGFFQLAETFGIDIDQVLQGDFGDLANNPLLVLVPVDPEILAILNSLFNDVAIIDLLTELAEFDVEGVLGLINLDLSPELILGFLLPPELIDLLFPDGIPADFVQVLVDVVEFIELNLNGLVIDANQPLSQEQKNILILVALFDPLIAENLDRIQNDEVDGAEFFGFLNIENIDIAVEDVLLTIAPQKVTFAFDVDINDVEGAVVELGQITTPTFVVNELGIQAEVLVTSGEEEDLVVVDFNSTAIFRAAIALVVGDDITDIGLFGVESGDDIESVGEDVLGCAASQTGFSLLAIEQAFTVELRTTFPDAADAGLQNVFNNVFALTAPALPQLVSNLLLSLNGDSITLDGDSVSSANSCLATSISANSGGNDNVGLIVGVLFAVVAIAAIVGVAAYFLVKKKNQTAPQNSPPVAQVMNEKEAAIPQEGKLDVSY